jgi:LTXXQ motif family protein
MFAAYVGCVPGCRDVSGWPIGRIEQAVSPTEDQRHLLDDLANASFRAAQVIKETCPTTVSFAPTGRLDAMQKRMEGMVQAIDIAGPPLDKFYASLTDEQKARLDAANEHTGRSNSLANCGAASSATQWPGDRIEMAVRPNEQKQAKLDALKDGDVGCSRSSRQVLSVEPAADAAGAPEGNFDAARHHADCG